MPSHAFFVSLPDGGERVGALSQRVHERVRRDRSRHDPDHEQHERVEVFGVEHRPSLRAPGRIAHPRPVEQRKHTAAPMHGSHRGRGGQACCRLARAVSSRTFRWSAGWRACGWPPGAAVRCGWQHGGVVLRVVCAASSPASEIAARDLVRHVGDRLRGLVGGPLGGARDLLADRAGLARHRGERLLGGVVGVVDEGVDARVELLGVGLEPRDGVLDLRLRADLAPGLLAALGETGVGGARPARAARRRSCGPRRR